MISGSERYLGYYKQHRKSCKCLTPVRNLTEQTLYIVLRNPYVTHAFLLYCNQFQHISFNRIFRTRNYSPAPPTPSPHLPIDFANEELSCILLIPIFRNTRPDLHHFNQLLLHHTTYSLDFMTCISRAQLATVDTTIRAPGTGRRTDGAAVTVDLPGVFGVTIGFLLDFMCG